jgi:hypothetical protein
MNKNVVGLSIGLFALALMGAAIWSAYRMANA